MRTFKYCFNYFSTYTTYRLHTIAVLVIASGSNIEENTNPRNPLAVLQFCSRSTVKQMFRSPMLKTVPKHLHCLALTIGLLFDI